jgi:hypothetical protein
VDDTGLIFPINSSGGSAGLSHVTLCYDFELHVSKTANTYWKNTTTWTIDKQVTPSAADRNIGESATFDYTLVIDRTDTASNWRIYGAVTIHNPSPFSVGYTYTDVIGNAAVPVTLVCDKNPIPAGHTATCSYEIFPAGQAYAGEYNVVTVTSTNSDVGGGTDDAQIIWGAPQQVGPTSVNAVDTPNYDGFNPGSWNAITSDQSIPYQQTYTCSTDRARYDATTGKYTETINNKAELKDGTTVIDDDTETVTINCYRPLVSKTASASFNRTWTWTVRKSVTPTSLTLATGQVAALNYTVQYGTSSADNAYAISGTITVQNPNPSAEMNVSVADVLNDGTPVTINCGDGVGDTTLTVSANSSGVCSYSAAPSNPNATLNTATATLNGVGFSGTAPVSFTMNEIDECVKVSDTFSGSTVTDSWCRQGATFT